MAHSSLTTEDRIANDKPKLIVGRQPFDVVKTESLFLGEIPLKVLTFLLTVVVALTLTTTAAAQTTGDLKIRFEYGGKAFAPKPLNPNKDVAFCGNKNLVDENLLVNQANNGIKNVVVYVYTGRGGAKLDKVKPANNTHTLANKGCRFEPRILVTQTGDTLKVTNPDMVGHNANMNFFNNKAENVMIPAGRDATVELKKAEPAPIPIDCNIHPWMKAYILVLDHPFWMKAYILVLDHPFAAVSDENGDMVIKGLPAGKKLMFRVYHEAGAIKEVNIDGKKEAWKRSRFEVEIKEGMNDLGTVVVPAAALK